MGRTQRHTTAEVIDWLSERRSKGAGVILVHEHGREAVGWVNYEERRIANVASRRQYWSEVLELLRPAPDHEQRLVLRRSRTGRFDSIAKARHGIQEHRCLWIARGEDTRSRATARERPPIRLGFGVLLQEL